MEGAIPTPTGFIDDDYTEEGYIAIEAGYHEPLEFTFRPVLADKREAVSTLMNNADPDRVIRGYEMAAQVMATDSLKSWSLKNRHGNAVPITAVNLRKVRGMLFDKLWLTVAGFRPSDVRPDGTPPRKVNLEADAKN